MSYKKVFQNLCARFAVKDIVPPRCKYIFVLESPHTEELKYSAPVSGRSGRSMTKALFGEEAGKHPLGRLAKMNLEQEKHHSVLDNIGIMNICQIPMQSSAYDLPILESDEIQFYKALEQFRTAGKPDSNNEVYRLIRENLDERLKRIRGRRVEFVPCGRFAQDMLNSMPFDVLWTARFDVPHPSRNQWSQEKYKGVIQEVVTKVTDGGSEEKSPRGTLDTLEGKWFLCRDTSSYAKFKQAGDHIVLLYLDAFSPDAMCFEEVKPKDMLVEKQKGQYVIRINGGFVNHFGAYDEDDKESIYDENGDVIESKLKRTVVDSFENQHYQIITDDEFDEIWEQVKRREPLPEIHLL